MHSGQQKNASAFLHSLHPCNSAIAEEQKSANAMDGVNADFAGAKICPAADTCQSSRLTPYNSCLSYFMLVPKSLKSRVA
ncbi:MAG: hypothetical protein CVV06_16075 [Gammaproteobacteria bacterium HGW-Gammaproteobacteria-10]|nr:MAG: hypothetical protein CVV06_16075 [Gammaproteobacteria bacterium HGW-Gammaproteobacteria-10]